MRHRWPSPILTIPFRPSEFPILIFFVHYRTRLTSFQKRVLSTTKLDRRLLTNLVFNYFMKIIPETRRVHQIWYLMTFKLYDFQMLWLWESLVTVIPETRRVHQIWYLRLYHMFITVYQHFMFAKRVEIPCLDKQLLTKIFTNIVRKVGFHNYL